MPTNSTERLLARTELRLARRLESALTGERRGVRLGPGEESAITRAYEPGDDLRWLDWPLTARSGEPMVRVPRLDPMLVGHVLVDLSGSMNFGSVGQTKRQLAEEVALGVGIVMRRRGDRIALAGTSAQHELLRCGPPRADRRATRAATERLAAAPTGGSLAAAARRLSADVRGSIVVVCSDFAPEPGLETALRQVAARNDLICIDIHDRREWHLPLGSLVLADCERGDVQRVEVTTAMNVRLRELFAAARAEREAMFSRLRARHCALSTGEEWIPPVARVLADDGSRRR